MVYRLLMAVSGNNEVAKLRDGFTVCREPYESAKKAFTYRPPPTAVVSGQGGPAYVRERGCRAHSRVTAQHRQKLAVPGTTLAAKVPQVEAHEVELSKRSQSRHRGKISQLVALRKVELLKRCESSQRKKIMKLVASREVERSERGKTGQILRKLVQQWASFSALSLEPSRRGPETKKPAGPRSR